MWTGFFHLGHLCGYDVGLSWDQTDGSGRRARGDLRP